MKIKKKATDEEKSKKKRRKGAGKGSSFEREICKMLSLWWTGGERDDVFWRSSQSGGRATIRKRTGKTTAGSYGDIAAIDVIGAPLLQYITFELKRGYKQWSPFDALDVGKGAFGRPRAQQTYELFLQQMDTDRENSGSKFSVLVYKKDKREQCIALPTFLFRELIDEPGSYITVVLDGQLSYTFMLFSEFLQKACIDTLKELIHEFITRKKDAGSNSKRKLLVKKRKTD